MLQLVDGVKLQGATVKADAFTSQRSDQIVFTLPAEATDGEVMLLLKSGVEVPAGSIQTVVPTNLSAAPSPVKNGATLTITGNDLDLITSVAFPAADGNVEAEIASKSAGELKVKVPEAAQSGNVTLSLANGKTVAVACIIKASTITAISPESLMAGEQLVIRGTDLDLVASVTFPVDQTIEAKGMKVTAQAIVLNVPSGAAGTGFVLNLKNGTKVENKTLVIRPSTNPTLTNAPSGHPGKSVTIEGANYNSVEAIYIGSTKVVKITERSDSKMTFVIPETVAAGEHDLILKTSDGGSFNVGKITVVPNEMDITANCVKQDDQNTQMSFPVTLTWDDNGRFRIQRNAPVDITKCALTAGKSKIKFHVTSAGQMQFNDANWSELGVFTAAEGDNVVEVTLTQTMIDWLTGAQSDGWSNSAFIIQGSGLTITKITLVP